MTTGMENMKPWPPPSSVSPLLGVGAMICYSGMAKIYSAWNGETLPSPGWIALVAALLSIGLKEWTYQVHCTCGT